MKKTNPAPSIQLIGAAARAFIEGHGKQFIGGLWTGARGEELPVIDPATEVQIATLHEAGATEVEEAVNAAKAAFATNSPWRRCGPQERERLLNALADTMEKDADVLADLISAEVGAPRAAARSFEVEKAIQVIRYFAGFPTKISGRTLDMGPDMGGAQFHSYTAQEPVGVVAAIIPWNAPLMLAAWKLGPALAAGCTLVIKPSELASLVVLRLIELTRQVGFPPGVINVVVGRGHTVGESLVAHPGVDKIAFTGSVAVGKQIHRIAGDRMLRLSLELGGKSPVIVMDDVDLDVAVPGIAMGTFANSGQVCVAGTRVFAHRKIADALRDKLAGFAASLNVGSGLEPQTQIGPVISKRQFDRVTGYIEQGLRDGGQVVAGGLSPFEKGYFIAPTILEGLPADSRLLCEEIFGPVMTLETFDDPFEVVERTNAGVYGLAAVIWGRSHAKIQRIARDLRVGAVFINTPPLMSAGVPTGGFRQSGIGRDLGFEGLQGYLETKSVIARIG
jgi:acyl-CoA reductase-like NAD-dependent aldehyde dehydrogenase